MIAIPLVFVGGLGGIVVGLRGTSAERPVCVLDDCPLEIQGSDSGSAYSYRIGSRFSVTLDSAKYPKDDFSITCTPEGAVGSISNIPAVTPPRYVLRFEGTKAGVCQLRDREFKVQVRFVGET